MAADERLVTCIWIALAVRYGTWRFEPPASPVAFSPRSWPDLLLGVFLAGVSNSRIDWAARNSSRGRIPAGIGRAVRPCGLLVCTDSAVVFERCAHAHGNLLGGHGCLAAAGHKFLAARHAGGLFRVLPLVRECRAGFFRLSV